ncbi:hypothetical protein A9G28_08730 [Gilliamella sp. Fer1-1]|jgi:hypothetical protein|uniref:hypothetical protein n=1 Tax=unclassified Gilliamella TaxID=2685620 RepID=UPI00080E8C94|nr:hypothetical protein [Gilliamella apicola]OCG15081.1 hypothetical protein A9G47_12890 [Gilliamella apicola]OCG26761.1 hypothetical protein A9G46_04115 [Gilliamella apicola]OCG27453.1 hypothetical protein A9G45_08805 [Gilliamella apicola]OCG40155.1 hypothetical protein A9G28_08730 [Gilliamella apicola]
MKKSYFVTYGSDKSKEEISEFLHSQLDITCCEHDSFYFGVYFSYSGTYADKLTIKDNYISLSNEWLNEEYKQFNTLIEASFINGKNVDKLDKYNTLKKQFNQFSVLLIISDKCIEED